MACTCQSFGKSGVPYPSGKCMICGVHVDWTLPIIQRGATSLQDAAEWRTHAEQLAKELDEVEHRAAALTAGLLGLAEEIERAALVHQRAIPPPVREMMATWASELKSRLTT